MFKAFGLRVNRQRMGARARERVVEGGDLTLSWAVADDAEGAEQAGFSLNVSSGGRVLHESGRVNGREQEYKLSGLTLPEGAELLWQLTIHDTLGQTSETAECRFYIGDVKWSAPWIAASDDEEGRPVYFRYEFEQDFKADSARMYVCGLGYHKVYINGEPADDAVLDPAHTDYTKVCQYVLLPDLGGMILEGKNTIEIIVGEGWRRNNGKYLANASGEAAAFFGPPQLSMMLMITAGDGRANTIMTGEDWRWSNGPVVKSNLFDGETFDARLCLPGARLPGGGGYRPVAIAGAPGGDMRPMLIPPIREMDVLSPVSISCPAAGSYVVDFGKNISGYLRIRTRGMSAGQQVAVRHMELLDEDGALYLPNLRGARAEDRYIAAGDERDPDQWSPLFTYHGFRYAQFEGFVPDYDNVRAVHVYTDIDSGTSFRCGSAILEKFHENVLTTERDNMHSILTDCPQRDERMGWMNDATVRFEETPYNFETAAMFRKIVRDIAAGQRGDGAISCTSPFIYGSYPADPVCSSYLVAAMRNYLHSGDVETIAENYEGFKAWEQCLIDNSTNYIVNYSYYGDWAAPAYACEGEDGARSIVTPGEYVSTCFSYYNCRLLEEFARILGREDEAERYFRIKSDIHFAILDRWYDSDSAVMATGSQACQALALMIGVIPHGDRPRAAGVMARDLVERGYRFTTGNLCTRYMLDALSEYGYIDLAYELMTREDYPSYGFMMQQEATTIWERFELKKASGMNSHNHPMYGSTDFWLFRYLCGIKPTDSGFGELEIAPILPSKLMSAQASLDTVKGRLNVKWVKRYGHAHLYIDIPFGVVAQVTFGGVEKRCGKGSHHFSAPL